MNKYLVHHTHDSQEALMYADTIFVIQAGKLVQQGIPQVLYHCPKNPYVATLFANHNVLSSQFMKKYWGEARKAHIRSEEIEVSKEATPFLVKPDRVKYMGAYYEHFVEIDKQSLRFFYPENLFACNVYLKIHSEKIHYF